MWSMICDAENYSVFSNITDLILHPGCHIRYYDNV